MDINILKRVFGEPFAALKEMPRKMKS